MLVPAGSMSVMWGGLWHRVAPNASDTVRKNVFLEYAPSWIVPGDHHQSDAAWLAGLTRRQRIVMRSYANPNDLVKLPADDVPLVSFEEIESRGGRAPRDYSDEVPVSLRKFPTRAEIWATEG